MNAFGKEDDTLSIAAKSIAEIITMRGTVNLDFTYDVPFTASMAGKAAVWVICLVPGLAVMTDRLKKAREGQM